MKTCQEEKETPQQKVNRFYGELLNNTNNPIIIDQLIDFMTTYKDIEPIDELLDCDNTIRKLFKNGINTIELMDKLFNCLLNAHKAILVIPAATKTLEARHQLLELTTTLIECTNAIKRLLLCIETVDTQNILCKINNEINDYFKTNKITSLTREDEISKNIHIKRLCDAILAADSKIMARVIRFYDLKNFTAKCYKNKIVRALKLACSTSDRSEKFQTLINETLSDKKSMLGQILWEPRGWKDTSTSQGSLEELKIFKVNGYTETSKESLFSKFTSRLFSRPRPPCEEQNMMVVIEPRAPTK